MTKFKFLALTVVALLATVSACKKKEAPAPVPPPIAQGKCLVDKYIDEIAVTQSCLFVGYRWQCEWGVGGTACVRGEEAASATERTPVQKILEPQ